MADRTIDSISVALGIDTKGLQDDLNSAKGMVDSFTQKLRDRQISIRVRVNKNALANDIEAAFKLADERARVFGEKPIPLKPTFTVTKASADQLRQNLSKTLAEMGEAKYARIPIKPELSQQRISGFMNQLQARLDKTSGVFVDVHWRYPDGPPKPPEGGITIMRGPRGGGGGGGGGTGRGPGRTTPTGSTGGVRTAGGENKAPMGDEALAATLLTAEGVEATVRHRMRSGGGSRYEKPKQPTKARPVSGKASGAAPAATPARTVRNIPPATKQPYTNQSERERYEGSRQFRENREIEERNRRLQDAVDTFAGAGMLGPFDAGQRPNRAYQTETVEDPFRGRARGLASAGPALPEDVIEHNKTVGMLNDMLFQLQQRKAKAAQKPFNPRVTAALTALRQGQGTGYLGQDLEDIYTEITDLASQILGPDSRVSVDANGAIKIAKRGKKGTGATPEQLEQLGTLGMMISNEDRTGVLDVLRRKPGGFRIASGQSILPMEGVRGGVSNKLFAQIMTLQGLQGLIGVLSEPATVNKRAGARGAKGGEAPPISTIPAGLVKPATGKAKPFKDKSVPVGRPDRTITGPDVLAPEKVKRGELNRLGGYGPLEYGPEMPLAVRAVLDRLRLQRRGLGGMVKPLTYGIGGKMQHWKGKQPYLVGEMGSEIFVPESAGWIIPHHLMDQLPKRAGGGRTGDSQRNIDAAGGITYGEPPASTDVVADVYAKFPKPKFTPIKRTPRVPAPKRVPGRSSARIPEVAPDYLGVEGAPVYTPEQIEAVVQSGNIDLLKQLSGAFKKLDNLVDPRKVQFTQNKIRSMLGGLVSRPVSGSAALPVEIRNLSSATLNSLHPTFRKAVEEAIAKEGPPGGGGGGGGGDGGDEGEFEGGGGGKKKLPKTTISALERDIARRKARESVRLSSDPESIQAIAGEIAERQQLTPVRALSVAFGQLASNLLGGRADVLRRTREAQASLGLARAAERDLEKINDQQIQAEFKKRTLMIARDKALKEGDTETVAATDAEIESTDKSIAELKERAKLGEEYANEQKKTALSTAKRIAGPRQVVSSLLAGIGGITIGTIGFNLILGAVQTGLDAVGKAVEKTADQMLGFAPTATKVTSALADQTTALHGNSEAAVAAAAETAGLSARTLAAIGPQLQLTAGVKAGAAAQEQAQDIFRTAQGQPGGVPQGLFGGYGGLFGTSLLAQQLGGHPGFSETVAGGLKGAIGAQTDNFGSNLDLGLKFLTNADFRDYLNQAAPGQFEKTVTNQLAGIPVAGPLAQLFQGVSGATNGNPLGALTGALPILGPIGSAISGVTGISGIGGPAQPGKATPFVPLDQRLDPERLRNVNLQLGNFNDEVARGSKRLGMTANAQLEFAKSQDEINQGMRTAILAGDDYGLSLAKQGIVLKDNTHKVIDNAVAYQKAYETAATGAGIPDFNTLISQMKQQIAATRAGISAQGGLERGLVQPSQQALGLIAQPLLPFGSTFSRSGASGATLGALGGITKQANSLDAQLKTVERDGRKAMMALVPPELQSQFKVVLDQVTQLGQGIAATQRAVAQRDLNYQVAQYNNELRIANRSLTDARQLTGQIGRTSGDNLGYLERENMLLGRQATQLDLILQQRRITTQLALAQFQAPGESPQERAVRRMEAITEAQIAQKQLNISKAQFKVGVQIVDAENLRQVTDLVHSISLLKQGKQVSILDAADAELLQRMVKMEDIALAKAQSFLSEGAQVKQAAIDAATQVASVTGEAFDTILKATAKAWGIMGSQYQTFLAVAGGAPSIQNTLPTGTNRGATGQHGNTGDVYNTGGRGNAGGFLGSVSGPTMMLVGEAGPETVAILRNPRNVTTTGAGGGGPVTVNVSVNANVRNDQDLNAMAMAIAHKVEEALNRKALLLGLRGPSR